MEAGEKNTSRVPDVIRSKMYRPWRVIISTRRAISGDFVHSTDDFDRTENWRRMNIPKNVVYTRTHVLDGKCFFVGSVVPPKRYPHRNLPLLSPHGTIVSQ